MAAETLSVRDDGSWKAVKFPHVYDTNISSNQSTAWKKIHKVHVYDGGSWKVAHKSNWDDYELIQTDTWTTGQTFTVPAGTKYIDVTIVGHGGGGGGSAGATAHHACGGSPSPSNETATSFSAGQAGGAGGYARAVFEVQEGSKYYWGNTAESGGPAGGSGTLETVSVNDPPGHSHSIGETISGGTGGSYDILFRTDTSVDHKTNISIDANGGGGGGKGILTVATRCFSISGRLGYNFTVSNNGAGANGSGTVTIYGSSVYELAETTNGGGHPGGVAGSSSYPPTGGSASTGGSGTVQIKQYGIS